PRHAARGRAVGRGPRRLACQRPSRGLRFDGAQYDYSDADVIFVANLVRPKQAVLTRILHTAPDHVRIILRDLYSLGLLWAEEGAAALDPSVTWPRVAPVRVFFRATCSWRAANLLECQPCQLFPDLHHFYLLAARVKKDLHTWT